MNSTNGRVIPPVVSGGGERAFGVRVARRCFAVQLLVAALNIGFDVDFDVDVPIDLVVVTPDLSSPGRREVTVVAFIIIYGFLRLRKTGEFLILVMDGRSMTVEISI